MTRRPCRALLSAALLLAACAQEQKPRSFLQPNVIRKTDLVGTWHYLQTVLDVPPTNSSMFIGLSSELMKIRFDVQEGHLYARRSYEQIENSEEAAKRNPDRYLGQIMAAWRIESHFDVIRDYNPTTGEETNRIIESHERPWNEREFIRVDWSQQLATDYQGLGLNLFFDEGDTQIQPVSYWESDPTKPDALHLERADESDDEFAAGEANYLDLVNKMVVTPTQKTVCLEENGQQQCFTYPACFFSYQVDDCASQVIKVRHAFAKISPQHDFEPRNWDGRQMEMFGIWDVGLRRLSYDRDYGITNTGAVRKAARFNLWKRSYYPDGTAIPFVEREQRTIPYYAGSTAETFPPALFESGREVVRQWNEAAQKAVSLVSGNDAPADVFVWCHNPVKLDADADGPADHPACRSNLKPERDANGDLVADAKGRPVYRARTGDPRRSTIFWVNEMQAAGPLGYGPPMFDPETGEIISGQAYIYGASLDTYAARSRDLVLLLAGKLSTQDFVDGANVQQWVEKARREEAGAQLHTTEEAGHKAHAMDFSWARGAAPQAPINADNPSLLLRTLAERREAMGKAGVFGNAAADLGDLRRARLRGGPLESMMIPTDLLPPTGPGAGGSFAALSEEEKMRISPLRRKAALRELERRSRKLGAFGVCHAEFADEGMAQRALALARDPEIRNMDPEQILAKLRQEIFLGVTLHEMGHNVGLRHNFRGSWDALNYFPKFWELRDAGRRSTKRFTGIDPTTLKAKGTAYQGADCGVGARMRPRWVDCPGGAASVEEVEGGVREHQYSSIMDYGAEFNMDLMGLGYYDKAAIKFSYADQGYVEVFTKTRNDTFSRLDMEAIHAFRSALGMASPIKLTAPPRALHYTDYPSLFQGGWRDMAARADVPFSTVRAGGLAGVLMVDGQNRPVVPYYFCGDEYAGNLTCQRFDGGADVWEQSADLISRYENFYLLNNFKRDRLTFHSSLGYVGRIAGRYLEPLRQQLTWYALYRAEMVDWLASFPDVTDGETAARDFFAAEQGWGGFTLAVTDGFDLLGRIIARPEPGQHVLVPAAQSDTVPWDHYRMSSSSLSPAAGTRVVGLLDGRWIDTTWDFDRCGYYWSEECQTRIGYFVDKTIALDVLSQSQAYFTGRDTSTDVRKYAIGYYVPFKKQVQEKLGAILAGDYRSLAPSFRQDGSVSMPSWTLATDGAGRTDLIDPAGGFTLQLHAGVYALSSFPTTFDPTFIDTTRVFVVGNGEAPVPDASLLNADGTAGPLATMDPAQTLAAGGLKPWLLWRDSAAGKTYAARSFEPVVDSPGRAPYRNDTAARMLEAARRMEALRAAACTSPDSASCGATRRALDNYRQNLAIMRSLHNAFGYGAYRTDAPFYY